MHTLTQPKLETLDRPGIERLVDQFYVNILTDPHLAPIFTAAIGSGETAWRPHLEKMYRFWASILLGEKSFHGNPMQTHRELSPFPLELFDRWLQLFGETADTIFVPEISQVLQQRAQRIAQSLRAGIESHPRLKAFGA